jgi:hypothetical protein
MSLASVLLILSLATLVLSFLLLLVKPDPDKRKWRKIVLLSVVLLCINVAAEVGKRIADARREVAAKEQESRQQQTFMEFLSEVRTLNASATQSFAKLNAMAAASNPSAVASLAAQAHRVQTQLSEITKLVTAGSTDASSLKDLKRLMEETRASITGLNTGIEVQRSVNAPTVRSAQEPERHTEPSLLQPTTPSSPAPDLSPPIILNTALAVATPSLVVPIHTQGRYPEYEPSTDSLQVAIKDGFVIAYFTGNGVSSGDSIKLRVSQAKRSTQTFKSYVIQPGSGLKNQSDNGCNMTIRRISGVLDTSFYRPAPFYRPVPMITVPTTGSETYMLSAFCIEPNKDNPSQTERFTLESPVRVFSCFALSGQHLSIQGYQAAVWIYESSLTYSQANEKLAISQADWAAAQDVVNHCQSPN